MANRSFKSVNAVQQDVIIFACKATLGTAPAVTLTNGMGASSSWEDDVLTVTMDDKYNALLGFSVAPVVAGAGRTLVSADDSAINTTGIVTLTFNDDLAAADAFSLVFVLKNSSVTP